MTIFGGARSCGNESELKMEENFLTPHDLCRYKLYLPFFSSQACFCLQISNLDRDHVLRDLRPFICTYGGCDEENSLFDNWRDWAKHEQWYHNRLLRCPIHSEDIFLNIKDFQEHMKQSHAGSDAMIDEAVSASTVVSTKPDRPCPLCLCTRETMDALQRHMATHLQRIARFSLPLSTDAYDEDSEGDFGSANAALDHSRHSSSAGLVSLHWSDSQQDDVTGEPRQTEKSTALEPLDSQVREGQVATLASSYWSIQEQKDFDSLVHRHGHDWGAIARKMPAKTETMASSNSS